MKKLTHNKSQIISKSLIVTALVCLSGVANAGSIGKTFTTGDILTATDLNDIGTAVNDNDSRVGTAEGAITTNSGNIANNTTAINNNVGNITANGNAISTNQGDIANNASNIAINAGNISGNSADIQLNSSDIAALKSTKETLAYNQYATNSCLPPGSGGAPNTITSRIFSSAVNGNIIASYSAEIRINHISGIADELSTGFQMYDNSTTAPVNAIDDSLRRWNIASTMPTQIYYSTVHINRVYPYIADTSITIKVNSALAGTGSGHQLCQDIITIIFVPN